MTPAPSHLSKTRSYLQQAQHEWGSVASPPAVVTEERGCPEPVQSSSASLKAHRSSAHSTHHHQLPSPLQPRGKEERAGICQKWQNQGPGRQTQLNDAELFSSKELQGRSPNPTPINQPIYPIAYLQLPCRQGQPACHLHR